jgi:hypothetical protein
VLLFFQQRIPSRFITFLLLPASIHPGRRVGLLCDPAFVEILCESCVFFFFFLQRVSKLRAGGKEEKGEIRTQSAKSKQSSVDLEDRLCDGQNRWKSYAIVFNFYFIFFLVGRRVVKVWRAALPQHTIKTPLFWRKEKHVLFLQKGIY